LRFIAWCAALKCTQGLQFAANCSEEQEVNDTLLLRKYQFATRLAAIWNCETPCNYFAHFIYANKTFINLILFNAILHLTKK